MRLRALAKINLALDVIGRREDGYHEVRMIMQTIQMYDQLIIERLEQPGIRLTTSLPFLPVNEKNLVYRAAQMLTDEFHITEGMDIRLKKVIPVAAGMAGGSSDAAATLVGVNQLFRLGLSKKELMERGQKIGADVPYCVMRGTALAEGTGEKLTRLPPMPESYVLIAKPGVSVSTKQVYQAYDAVGVPHRPDIDGMIQALQNQDLYGVADRLDNVLEAVTATKYPIITRIKEEMKEGGALNALMSGSGPTVFGLFDDREKGEYTASRLKKAGLVRQSFLTDFFNIEHTGGI